MDTSEFVGSEGDRFRANLTTEMPPHLRITGDAFGQVAAALGAFGSTLAGLHGRMRPLAVQRPGSGTSCRWRRSGWPRPIRRTSPRAGRTAGRAGRRGPSRCGGGREGHRLCASTENPGRRDLAGNARNFVQDHKEGLQQPSTGLKVVSLVAGILSFTPLAPIAAPIAVGSALLASRHRPLGLRRHRRGRPDHHRRRRRPHRAAAGADPPASGSA